MPPAQASRPEGPERPPASTEKRNVVPTTSAALDDGVLLELIYDAARQHTSFIAWDGTAWRTEENHAGPGGVRLVPYSARNNLIANRVILFPSAPEEYGSDEELIADIRAYIHRYVDLSPQFEQIVAYYILLSWIHDGFNELPYLRIRGDYGSGKTRFLLTVGSLCYKPVFASGASTVSPIFHILDAFHGTLIIDEGDLRFSDEKADIVKILNNGNVRGIPVLRCEVSNNKEFNPRAFDVFGPKIVGTRGYYQDRALESRFITEELGGRPLRDDIPINLPSIYRDEALRLRNKLLLYRFRNHGRCAISTDCIDQSIEPRLNQIFAPLMSVIRDETLKSEMRNLARQYNNEMVMDRSMDVEAHVLEVVRGLLERPDAKLSLKEITDLFIKRYGPEYERPISPKWIGTVVRKKLGLVTRKSHGVYTIAATETPKLRRLFQKYGIARDAPEDPSVPDSDTAENLG